MIRLLALLVAMLLCGCAAVSAAAPATPAPAPSAYVAELDGLAVAPRTSLADYDRDAFGPAWADVDHNGCDTRNDVLRRDLADVETRAGTHGCVVIAGVLHDPYTGRTETFAKARASLVQIDHVVPLAEAWRTGASGWTPAQREEYANDQSLLLAVDGPENEAKGDDGPDAWRPPDRSYWCRYAELYVAAKAKYRLSTAPSEKAALGSMLAMCPS